MNFVIFMLIGSTNWTAIGQVISYVITVVIGGVGYKLYSLYLSNKLDHRKVSLEEIETTSETEKRLREELEKRVNNLISRMDELEHQRNETWEKYREVVEQLAFARGESRLLQKEVERLKSKIDSLKEELEHYKKEHD